MNMNDQKLQVAILTVSDSCHSGHAVDTSGPAIRKVIEKEGLIIGQVICDAICADDEAMIKEIIIEWCNTEKLDLILTTGGTGISPKDVTPEAVKAVLEKEVPGMAFRMISESLQITSLAMLSRPICGIRNKILIVTLPGSKKACVECLSFIAPALTHAIDLIKDNKSKVQNTHSDLRDTVIHPNNEPSNVVMPNVCMRKRVSPYPMVSVEEAQKMILDQVLPPIKEKKSLIECLNCVTADDIYAKVNLPPYRASKMDGYAVIASEETSILTVLGSSEAGGGICVEKRVTLYECLRISTGAFVPCGADAVLPVENTKLISKTADGKEEEKIRVEKIVYKGDNIRNIGDDIAKGSLVMKNGSKISPSDIGVLVSSGINCVFVHPKPSIAIISTGSELQDFEEGTLKNGFIYDCNRPTLTALLLKYVGELHDIGIARDNPTDLRSALCCAFQKADVVITTGGVSMGEKDLLKLVLKADFDATIWFGRVNLKPGKPTTFATCVYNNTKKFILALPGNPVSAVVTTTLFVIPLCRKISGENNCFGTTIKVKMNNNIKLDLRPEYQRVKLNWTSNVPEAVSTGIQESSRLMSLSSASALLKLPQSTDGRRTVNIGDEVDSLLLDF